MNRISSTVIALLLVACASASVTVQLAPLVVHGGLLAISLKIGDTDAKFLLDTGSYQSWVDAACLPAGSWRPRGRFSRDEGGEELPIGEVHGLRIGNRKLNPIMAFGVKPKGLISDRHSNITGILGYDVLSTLPMGIDLSAMRVIVAGTDKHGTDDILAYSRSRIGLTPFSVAALPATQNEDTGRPEVSMWLDGKLVLAMLDTGSTFTIVPVESSNNERWGSFGTQSLGGLDEVLQVELKMARTLKFSTTTVDAPFVAVSSASRYAMLGWQHLLAGGWAILNFPGQEILLPRDVTNSALDDALMFYGIQLGPQDEVLVLEGGLAAQAGLATGLRISMLDSGSIRSWRSKRDDVLTLATLLRPLLMGLDLEFVGVPDTKMRVFGLEVPEGWVRDRRISIVQDPSSGLLITTPNSMISTSATSRVQVLPNGAIRIRQPDPPGSTGGFRQTR
jgi:hypothetical protein